jgi:hypothetical protein
MGPSGTIADELDDVLESAETQRAIDASGKHLERMLEQRLLERRQGKRDFSTTLLLADEWPVIAAMSAYSISTMKRIVLEGQKVGMYALISGQGIPAALLDGTLVRDALSSRYVFNTTPQQARLAGLDNETARQLLAVLNTTGPGRAILASSRLKPEVIAVPHTTVNDIRACMTQETSVSITETRLQARSGQLTIDGNTSPEMNLTGIDPLASIGNDTRAIIKRMHKKGMRHGEIANLVGLSGRNITSIKLSVNKRE